MCWRGKIYAQALTHAHIYSWLEYRTLVTERPACFGPVGGMGHMIAPWRSSAVCHSNSVLWQLSCGLLLHWTVLLMIIVCVCVPMFIIYVYEDLSNVPLISVNLLPPCKSNVKFYFIFSHCFIIYNLIQLHWILQIHWRVTFVCDLQIMYCVCLSQKPFQVKPDENMS